ncbi:CBU_0592 family membrane protein [Mycolicibacterium sp.]|uniref:CBU_0592 family membrane protein n=1 Tax=Mycolicibacterium sp. TaxID=2320850 RepID=UPI003D0AEB11
MQVLQLICSLVIVACFTLAQFKILSTDSAVYIALNLIGSSVLAAQAWLLGQWGFFLMEATWAVVSTVGMYLIARKRLGRRSRRSSATPAVQDSEHRGHTNAVVRTAEADGS